MENPDLNKSFCQSDSDVINALTQIKNNQDDFFEDILESGLIPNTASNNFGNLHDEKKLYEENVSYPSSELNLLDSSLPKSSEKKYFFRELTKSHCEMNADEGKALVEKILTYYKNSNKEKLVINNSGESFNNYLNKKNPITPEGSRNRNFFPSPTFSMNNLAESEEIPDFAEKEELKDLNSLFDSQEEFRSGLKLLKSNQERYNRISSQIHFNILVVGESGSGKTTFIRSFMRKLRNMVNPKPNESRNESRHNQDEGSSINRSVIFKPTTNFGTYSQSISSNPFLKSDINIIDSPGYGSILDNQAWIKDIKKFIKNRHQDYYNAKQKHLTDPDKSSAGQVIIDTRIHVCLYFMTYLKDIDIEFMKVLSSLTNLIPVLSKGDNFQKKEDAIAIKRAIMNISPRIEFFDIHDALTNMCKNTKIVNYLLAGKYQFCPPFLISSSPSLNNSKWRIYDDNSDFMRLYTILVCYISFECVETSKKFYLKFKEKLLRKKYSDDSSSKLFKVKYMLPISVAVGLISLFWLSHKKMTESSE